MVGRAVVTTRLSSTTMNSATLVRTNVQMVARFPVMCQLLSGLSSECLLTNGMKKGGGHHFSSISPSSRFGHSSPSEDRSMAAATLSSMPVANQARTCSASAPETSSTNRISAP